MTCLTRPWDQPVWTWPAKVRDWLRRRKHQRYMLSDLVKDRPNTAIPLPGTDGGGV